MEILWIKEAWEEYLYWQSQDKKTLRRINALIQDILRNGYKGIGNPEPLRNDLSGYYSVRIDKKNRIIFRIVDNTLEIISCKTHYNDK